MEEEKKKKRNKKKKNKQTKITEDAAVSASGVQNNVIGQKSNNQVSETEDIQNDALPNADMDLDRRQANGTKGSVLSEAEKVYWLNKEAKLEETIKQLQRETDAYIEKQAGLELKILQLQSETDSWLQKEAGYKEKIDELIDEKATLSLKGMSLEEKTANLERERESWVQKEMSLEEKITKFEGERESWVQKEMSLEEKITKLERERESWLQKEMSLEEKITKLERERESWVQKENSSQEMLASVNLDNRRLQAQVMELEESRKNILQEKQQLGENVSDLQLHIQEIERTAASAGPSSAIVMDLNSQIEVARALVEKLIAENAELVEKVNELYVELDQLGGAVQSYSAVGSDMMVQPAEAYRIAGHMPESSEKASGVGKTTDSFEDVLNDKRNSANAAGYAFKVEGNVVGYPNAKESTDVVARNERTFLSSKGRESLEDVAFKDVRDADDYVYTQNATVIQNSPGTIDSEEIVQIPLDESEVRDLELQTVHNERKADVPLSDAPLLGAPIRLLSFVARYVSGADLVTNSSVNSRP